MFIRVKIANLKELSKEILLRLNREVKINKEINKYFLTIVIFIISLFILTSLLSLSNIDFESSFKLAILTLMNTVNSSAYGLSDFNFIDLHFITKFFLIFFMIIGRVELLSLLLIAKKFLFKY